MMPMMVYHPPRITHSPAPPSRVPSRVPSPSAPSPSPSPTPTINNTASSSTATTTLPALLQQPSDLSKLPLIRRKLLKEKQAIDARLNEGVSRQLADTKAGLGALVGAREAVGRIREEVKGLEVIRGVGPDAAGRDWDGAGQTRGQGQDTNEALQKIAQVAKIARSLAQTVDIVTHLRHITSSCSRIDEMMDEDLREEYGERRNMLLIHASLRQLEQFRGEAMHLHASSSASASAEKDKKILQSLFEPLEALMKKFEDRMLWDVAGEVVEWIRRNRSGVVVRVWKVVEVEGKEDQKVSSGAVRVPASANRRARARPGQPVIGERSSRAGESRREQGFEREARKGERKRVRD
ncbi:hypothetical protein QFC22_006003 [Naganishia vaughanmartiniae]|uniref:Uncharacterized protein n=1 Tax=Naganishia vaughanmartiniae TaxID=1424756 RepID=A0ACC2WPJ6_9TREE|nr:hypothetical protein QFC22_006003 [Naganishia vaughanmartiniae]